VEVVSTGSLRLDLALGIGGIPSGALVEIYGPVGSGKTSLCLNLVAENQKLGKNCAWIDTDHTFDTTLAQLRLPHSNQLLLSEPNNAEEALGILEELVQTDSLGAIVLDSVTTLVPQIEFDTRIGSPTAIGGHQVLSQTLQRIRVKSEKRHTSIILTNQVASRTGEVYHQLSKNITRLALKLRASIRLNLKPLNTILRNKQPTGICVQARVVRNIFCPSFHSTKLDLMYNNGIIKSEEIFDLGVQLLIITRPGMNYRFENLHLGDERSEAVGLLENDTAIASQIEQVIRERLLTAAV
jgi:recombination protein RecA